MNRSFARSPQECESAVWAPDRVGRRRSSRGGWTVEKRRALVLSALGLTPAQFELLLTTAGRAPSLHNSQPWQFHMTAQRHELHADPDEVR